MSELHVEPSATVTATESPSQRSVAARTGSDLMTTLQSLAATIVMAVFLITFAVQAFQIPSESMEKTLLIGDYLLHQNEKAPAADVDGPWYSLAHTFVMERGASRLPKPPITAKAKGERPNIPVLVR